MKLDHVFLVGVGGTGTHLADPLIRLFAFHKGGTKNITIIDGDKFEDKNAVRQLFDAKYEGINKAVATADHLGYDWVHPHAGYVNQESFSRLLQARGVGKDDWLVVVMAVDNAATRHDLIKAIDEGGYRNFVALSPGNSYSTGECVAYVKQNGVPLTTHIFAKYRNIAEPDDHIPKENPGCADLTPSAPQLITANQGAAWCTMLTLSAMLDDLPWYEELHFSCVKMKMKPQGAPKEFDS